MPGCSRKVELTVKKMIRMKRTSIKDVRLIAIFLTGFSASFMRLLLWQRAERY